MARSGQQAHQLAADGQHVLAPFRPEVGVGEPLLQIVVSEKGAVVEILLAPFGQGEGRAQLVPLRSIIILRVGETAQHAQGDSVRMAAVHSDGARADGEAQRFTQRLARLFVLLQQHEIQFLVIGGEHQQRLAGEVAQAAGQQLFEAHGHRAHLHQVDADFGLRVCGHQMDVVDQVAQLCSIQPQRLMVELHGPVHVVAQPGEKVDYLLRVL